MAAPSRLALEGLTCTSVHAATTAQQTRLRLHTLQVVLKYNPLYRPDANASASLQPEQAGSVGVGRPTKRVSLKYNLRVVESTPDAVQSKAAAVSALDTMPEDSSDSIAAIRSSSQIAQEA